MYLAFPSIKSDPHNNSRNREFDTPLYHLQDVVGGTKFLEITRRSLDCVLPQPGRRAQISDDILTSISEITRELFIFSHRFISVTFIQKALNLSKCYLEAQSGATTSPGHF